MDLPRRVPAADYVHLIVERPPANANARTHASQRIEPPPGPFGMQRAKARRDFYDGRLHDAGVTRGAEMQMPIAARAVARVAVRRLRHLDGHFDEVCLDHDRGAFVFGQALLFRESPEPPESIRGRSGRRKHTQCLQ